MTDELSPTQALALWGLLARQGRIEEGKGKRKPDLDALIEGGFAEADGSSKTVSLTDRGWNWASEHLGAPSLDKQPVLTLFLGRLGEHLTKSGESLAGFIGEAPPLPEPAVKPKTSRAKAPPKEKSPPKPKASPKPKAPTAAALRQRIEDAYLRLSGNARSEPVRLSKLRAELGDLDRKTVDAGLARILKAKKETASLSQISDNKAIDAAEREAAYSPADDPFHLIRIQ